MSLNSRKKSGYALGSAKASSAAGKYSRQPVAQPLDLLGAFPDQRLMGTRHHLDRAGVRAVPATARSWWESVRTMSVSIWLPSRMNSL